MAVPFVDLQAQHRSLGPSLHEALARVIDDTSFILGPELVAFEREFAAFCKTSVSVGVGSGLDALRFGLEALGVGAGDEVITVANTYIATAFAISRVGAVPVLVDCDPVTMNIDPKAVERAITPRTKAIVPVHLYGQLADMAAIDAIAKGHGLQVLEDAAQAHGAERDGTRAGAFGDAAAFSFYPAKNLGALGDGGAVVTGDEAIAERIRLLRSYGQAVKNRHDIIGENSRLDTLHAAVLRVKLRHLDAWNAGRRKVAGMYAARLGDLDRIRLPEPPASPEAHVYHLFVVRVRNREKVQAVLHARGIQSGVHYPTPIHRQPAYAGHPGFTEGAFPHAEALGGEILSLPMFAEMSATQVDEVGSAIEAATA